MIQTFGMLLDFRNPKNTRLAARLVFLRSSKVSQYPVFLARCETIYMQHRPARESHAGAKERGSRCACRRLLSPYSLSFASLFWLTLH